MASGASLPLEPIGPSARATILPAVTVPFSTISETQPPGSKTMTNDGIKSFLHLHEVDHEELMNILLHYFSSSQHPDFSYGLKPAPLIYKFQAQNSPHSIDVIANEEDGQIVNIQFSDGFPEEQLQHIEQRVKDILLTTETAIGQAVLFCLKRVTGHFRYKDIFQILPVPENAPVPNIGPPDYAFLMQFCYIKSNDTTIGSSRRMKKATTYTKLLNFLCNQKIRLNRNNAQLYWVLDRDKSNNKVISRYLQEGYIFEDTSGFDRKNFTDTSAIEPIKIVSFQEYHTGLEPTSRPLKLSDNIEQSLDRIFALSDQDYDRFFRACTWYEKGQDIWQDSASSSFVALASAIETLIGEKPIKCGSCGQDFQEGLLICDKCQQPRYQVTKRFKEFLEDYVPNLISMPKEAFILYSTRSHLAHGAKLFQHDLKPWSFAMNPIRDVEANIQRNLFHITRTAIYNWLWRRK